MEIVKLQANPLVVNAFRWTGDAADLPNAFSWLSSTNQTLGAQVIATGSSVGLVELSVGAQKARPGQWLLLRSGSWMVMDDENVQAGWGKVV